MARLFVPNLYKLQHAILYHAWDKPEMVEGKPIGPTIHQLAFLTEASETEVLRAVYYLKDKGLVHNDPKLNVICSPTGEVALRKEDLLEEGWEKFKANLLRWVQISGLSVGIIVAIINFTGFGKSEGQSKELPSLPPTKATIPKEKQLLVPHRKAIVKGAQPNGRDSLK